MTDLKVLFTRLVDIMDELREKCPWDQKQTIQSLRPMTLEETYELVDAITDNDWHQLREELGDLLLHIIFYARIAREQKQFTLEEVIEGISEKLIRRHPHIYGDPQEQGLKDVRSAEDVKQNWEQLKLKEGKKSVLSGLPASLPALVKAMRIQEKSKQVGFEWEHTGQVWEKVKEELGELEDAVKGGDKNEMEDEFGDVIFSLVNYARFLELDAENALERTNKKFISRFSKMEAAAAAANRQLNEMTLEEMDQLWNQIKASDRS
jgi:XTP/dITP diphosphohydrolase